MHGCCSTRCSVQTVLRARLSGAIGGGRQRRPTIRRCTTSCCATRVKAKSSPSSLSCMSHWRLRRWPLGERTGNAPCMTVRAADVVRVLRSMRRRAFRSAMFGTSASLRPWLANAPDTRRKNLRHCYRGSSNRSRRLAIGYWIPTLAAARRLPYAHALVAMPLASTTIRQRLKRPVSGWLIWALRHKKGSWLRDLR